MRRLQHHHTSRRAFVKRAGAAALAPWIIPATSLGAGGNTAPSDRITLGFIGVGYMGQRHHLSRFVEYPEAQVLAVCDVDRWRRENARATVEKAYSAQQTSGAYRGCAAYNDFRELLARDDIDAVLIATGDRWHAPIARMAAEAGKDIFLEKPISKTIAQARATVEAIRSYGRVLPSGSLPTVGGRVPTGLPIGPRRNPGQDRTYLHREAGRERRDRAAGRADS